MDTLLTYAVLLFFLVGFATLAIWVLRILWLLLTGRWRAAGRVFLTLFEGDDNASSGQSDVAAFINTKVVGYVVQYTEWGTAGWVTDSGTFGSISSATAYCQQKKSAWPKRAYRVAEVNIHGEKGATVYSL